MRILRLTAAAAAATAAVLVDPRAASAFQPPNQTLTLSPTSGPRTTSITATFQFPLQGKAPASGCRSQSVVFSWDGFPLSTPMPAGPTTSENYCAASLTFPPPGGLSAPGGHRVQATGGRTSGAATFTVTGDPAPDPAPPPRPSATPTPPVSAPSSSTSTALPSGSASPSTTLSSALPSASAADSAEPLPSEVPSYEASPAIVGALKPPSGTSIGVIIAILVGAMTIAGAGLLIGLAMRNRPDVDEVSADGLTAEQ